MNYKRVIPRDFFNEAKLLKCLGAFVICIEKNPELHFTVEEDGESFDIRFDGASLELYCANYTFSYKEQKLYLFTPYNSKGNYPLYCRGKFSDVSVFDDNGNFSDEFLELLGDS